ncbi:MAG TPA: O-methyltransferase [Abditibacteriaceae bacterium]|jgi:caffeoyl-CoA O-methyltransferase|nr:O-methyltransferase [Abditibacteriaceae bacterium]
MEKFISLTQPIYTYLLQKRSDVHDEILAELRRETAALGEISGYQIGPEQGTFMSLLAAVSGARRALEIGTFTGYSALCIARGLPQGATLTCLDKSGEWTQIAQRFWQRAGVTERIELRLGDAHETLKTLVDEGCAPFDFVFIDADKSGYEDYFEVVRPHLAPNALVIFDNMLREGRVAQPPLTDADDIAIDALNTRLANDARLETVLIPVGDGLLMCRVR